MCLPRTKQKRKATTSPAEFTTDNLGRLQIKKPPISLKVFAHLIWHSQMQYSNCNVCIWKVELSSITVFPPGSVDEMSRDTNEKQLSFSRHSKPMRCFNRLKLHLQKRKVDKSKSYICTPTVPKCGQLRGLSANQRSLGGGHTNM